MGNVLDYVKDLFIDCIIDEDFILGLDYTGLYAFTTKDYSEAVKACFENLLYDVRITLQQSVLCCVDSNGRGKVDSVPLEDLPEWVLGQSATRNKCLTADDLMRIKDCYGIVVSDVDDGDYEREKEEAIEAGASAFLDRVAARRLMASGVFLGVGVLAFTIMYLSGSFILCAVALLCGVMAAGNAEMSTRTKKSSAAAIIIISGIFLIIGSAWWLIGDLVLDWLYSIKNYSVDQVHDLTDLYKKE